MGSALVSVSVQYEHTHAILHSTLLIGFFIGLGVGSVNTPWVVFQVFDQWFFRGDTPIVTLTRTFLFKRESHLHFRTFRPCLHVPTPTRSPSCLFLPHLQFRWIHFWTRPSNSFRKMVHIGNKHFIWFSLVQNNNGANKWSRWWADQNVTRSKQLINCGFIYMH